jgi:hypothetical protein
MDHHPNETPPPPRTGAFYWVPVPPVQSLTWQVLACHHLGFDGDTGHTKVWPAIIPHLAAIWGRDPRAMKRRLALHCYGLPRGRVTRLKNVYLLYHGDDSPIPAPDWTTMVVDAFGLQGRRIKPLFDEHEQRLPDDVRALARVLGSFLTLPDIGTSQRDLNSREGRSLGTPGGGIDSEPRSRPPTPRTPPGGRRRG